MHVLREGVFFRPLHPVQSQLSCRRRATGYSNFHPNSTAMAEDAIPLKFLYTEDSCRFTCNRQFAVITYNLKWFHLFGSAGWEDEQRQYKAIMM